MIVPVGRRLAAEFLGTGMLVTAVVGSGITASRLSPDDVGLQLLENSIATALALAALIVMFGPVSGALFALVHTDRTTLAAEQARLVGSLQHPLVIRDFPKAATTLRELAPSCERLRAALS
jgi:hypothetical protein